jgi:hypothetical protein
VAYPESTDVSNLPREAIASLVVFDCDGHVMSLMHGLSTEDLNLIK